MPVLHFERGHAGHISDTGQLLSSPI